MPGPAFALDDTSLLAPVVPADPAERWAASGAMAITGRADGPALLAPATLTDRLDGLAERLRLLSAALGREVAVDGPALLGERAALTGATRQGPTSVGGATRLVPARDGWLAISLARADDLELVPAWLEAEVDPSDPWPLVTAVVATRVTADLVERATWLGLPVGALGETDDERAVLAAPRGDVAATTALARLVVVDLSSLWAGPLAAGLLAQAGARVIKVESATRPDGARLGEPDFFDLLNGGKESVALDFASGEDRALLHRLIERADVVIEASRSRALEQLGCAVERYDGTGPRVWISITGHGRSAITRDRVGFGDDAAVAGGLVARDERDPCFCADAVADPLTGLTAAVAALDRLAIGGRWHLDLALARVARWASDDDASGPRRTDLTVAPPRARASRAVAPPLGRDTASICAELAGSVDRHAGQ